MLSAQRSPWLLIDPKPLVGERAFDMGHLVRTLLPAPLDRAALDALVARLSRALDLDADRVRAWVFVRSVDDALWNIATDHQSPARDLAIARLLA